MTNEEHQQWLAQLEARWQKGDFAGPHEMVKMDKQMKEIRKRLIELVA